MESWDASSINYYGSVSLPNESVDGLLIRRWWLWWMTNVGFSPKHPTLSFQIQCLKCSSNWRWGCHPLPFQRLQRPIGWSASKMMSSSRTEWSLKLNELSLVIVSKCKLMGHSLPVKIILCCTRLFVAHFPGSIKKLQIIEQNGTDHICCDFCFVKNQQQFNHTKVNLWQL